MAMWQWLFLFCYGMNTSKRLPAGDQINLFIGWRGIIDPESC